MLGEWGSTVHGQIILENPSLNWVKEFFLTTGLLRAITELVFMANALGGKKKKKNLKCINQRTTKGTWPNMSVIRMDVMWSALAGANYITKVRKSEKWE